MTDFLLLPGTNFKFDFCSNIVISDSLYPEKMQYFQDTDKRWYDNFYKPSPTKGYHEDRCSRLYGDNYDLCDIGYELNVSTERPDIYAYSTSIVGHKYIHKDYRFRYFNDH